jgi:transmembrane sensor
LRVNESHALPDGSLVELKEGSRIAVDFSAEQRQVRLVGEAHFQVARDAARPFVVNAQGVMVRAVGTAFSVRVDSDEVQVLVTHGSVHVLTRGLYR